MFEDHIEDHIKDKIENIKNASSEEILNIFKEIFNPNNLYEDTLIPLKFLKTEIGSILINALSNSDLSQSLSIRTVSDETGYTRQYISQEIAKGNLKAKKEGKMWFIRRNDLNEYKRKKGLYERIK